MGDNTAKRYYRKRQNLWSMVAKMKLWPSRNGILHGVREIVKKGELAQINTHCGLSFGTRDSRNSRAARWLRAKQYTISCPLCRVPDWKLTKYGATVFSKRQGSFLSSLPEDQ